MNIFLRNVDGTGALFIGCGVLVIRKQINFWATST